MTTHFPTQISKRMAGLAVLAAISLAMLVAAKPPQAGATNLTNIYGTVTWKDPTASGRAGGAWVYVWRWNGSAWVNLGHVATANSSGNFSLNEPGGYYYYLQGSWATGACYVGSQVPYYSGWSPSYFSTYAGEPSVHSGITVTFVKYVTC